jgi:hypothetical protein
MRLDALLNAGNLAQSADHLLDGWLHHRIEVRWRDRGAA